jgi:hypothetical protein
MIHEAVPLVTSPGSNEACPCMNYGPNSVPPTSQKGDQHYAATNNCCDMPIHQKGRPND